MPRQRLVVATSNILLILSTFLASGLAGKVEGFSRTLSHKSQVSVKREKLTHFRLYWHDVLSGPKPTSVPVVKPANVSTFFGAMNMIDNPLTQGPDISSKLVGKAQGFYAVASQEEVGLLMSMNFAFSEGKYNGSTIAVLGRNMVMNKVREMPVIGGTGLFRFARGYVEARTSHWDPKTGDATVQYDCYVLHY